MRRAQLKIFIRNAMKASLPAKSSVENVYSHFNGVWSEEDGNRVTAADQLHVLNEVRTSNKIVSVKNALGSHAYIPIDGTLDAVVSIKCDANYQVRTLKRIASSLTATVQSSRHEYAATHSTLTGLVNKDEFRKRVEAEIRTAKVTPPSAEPSAPETTTQRGTISVIAFDIDFFKQINDDYGHDYGDVVLKVLALRLTTTATKLLGPVRNAAWELAHLSGEEFALYIAGPLPDDELNSIAEHLRASVADHALPSNDDLATVTSTLPAETLPRESERHLTVSIGVASEILGATQERPDILASRLLQQADSAMYRAKTGGRNCVRRYADIRAKLGRVLEHHKSPSLVAIDIGGSVGVRPGQEFRVFHPDFTGDTAFVVSDSRTNKRLGTYPRRPYATIVADDVQPTLAFCKILDSTDVTIERGSHLEAVPLGTISRSIFEGDVLAGDPSLLSPSQLRERSRMLDTPQTDAATIIFSLRDVDALLAKRGTIAVNLALTRLYDCIRRRMPAHADIGKPQITELAVLLAGGTADEFIQQVSIDFLAAVEGRVQLSIGAFQRSVYSSLAKSNVTADRSEFLPGAGIDLARYAASYATVPNVVQFFTPVVAGDILFKSRTSSKERDTLADFSRMHQLGLRSVSGFNHAALAAMIVSTKEAAENYLLAALEMEPRNATLHANMGWIHLNSETYAVALDYFRRAYSFDQGIFAQNGTYAYAIARLCEVLPETKSHFPAEQLLAAFERARSQFSDRPDLIEVIQSAELALQAPLS